MKGFLMLLGAGVFTVILIYGAWYVGTHFYLKKPTDDNDDFKLKHPLKKDKDNS